MDHAVAKRLYLEVAATLATMTGKQGTSMVLNIIPLSWPAEKKPCLPSRVIIMTQSQSYISRTKSFFASPRCGQPINHLADMTNLLCQNQLPTSQCSAPLFYWHLVSLAFHTRPPPNCFNQFWYQYNTVLFDDYRFLARPWALARWHCL